MKTTDNLIIIAHKSVFLDNLKKRLQFHLSTVKTESGLRRSLKSNNPLVIIYVDPVPTLSLTTVQQILSRESLAIPVMYIAKSDKWISTINDFNDTLVIPLCNERPEIVLPVVQRFVSVFQTCNREKTLAAIFQNTREGIITVDKKGYITLINPKLEEMIDIKANRMLNRHAVELAKELLGFKVFPKVANIIRKQLAGQPVPSFTLPFRNKVFEVSLSSIEPNGGYVGLIQDISLRYHTEQQIKASEAHYKDLVEHSSDLICTHDLQGRILSVNPAIEKQLGHSAQELLTMNIQDLLADEFKSQFRPYITALKKQGEAQGLMNIKDRAGNVHVWRYSNTLRKIGPGAIVRGMAHDVTEQVKSERRLRVSEAKYRYLVENSNDLIYTHDIDGNILTVNQAIERLLGYPKEQILHRNLHDLVLENRQKDLVDYLRRIKRDGKARGFIRLRTKDQQEMVWEYNNVLQKIPGEKPLIRGIARDVTQQVKYQEKIEASARQFESLFENSTIGLYRTTTDGRILLANKYLVSMLGYSSVEELQQRDLEKEGYEPGYDRRTFCKLAERPEGLRGYETAWIRKDGTRVYVRENAHTVRDHDGSILYYEGTVEDITPLVQSRREQQKLLNYHRTINELTYALGQTTTKRKMYRTTYLHIKHLFSTPVFLIAIYDDNEKTFHIDYAVIHNRVLQGVDLPPFSALGKHQPKRSRLIREGKPLHLKSNDSMVADLFQSINKTTQKDADKNYSWDAGHTFLLPMKTQGRTAGLMIIQSTIAESDSPAVLDLLTGVANVLSISYQNHLLVQSLTRELKAKEKIEQQLRQQKRQLEKEVARRTRELESAMRKHENASKTLSSILESSKGIEIYSVDPQFNYLAFNENHKKAVAHIWGKKLQVGINILEIFPNEIDRQKTKNNIERALNGENFAIVESYGLPPNQYYYENSYNPIFDNQGTVLGVSLFLRDITDQIELEEELESYRQNLEHLVEQRTLELKQEVEAHRSAEEALSESNARYKILFEDSPISLWEEDYTLVKDRLDTYRLKGIKDLAAYFEENPKELIDCVHDIRLVDANRASIQIFGARSKEDLFARQHLLFSTNNARDFIPDLVSLYSGELNFTLETPFRTLDGRDLQIILYRFIPTGQEATWSRILVAITDVSDLKRTAQLLQAEQEKFHSLTDTANDAIIGIDDSGQITVWNRAAESLFGYDDQEVIGKKMHRLIVPKSEISKAIKGLKSFRQTGRGPMVGMTVETEGIHKNGDIIPLELSISSYQIGQQWFATGIVRDIRQRKKEESFRKAIQELSYRMTMPMTLEELGRALAEELEHLFAYHAFGLFSLDWNKQLIIGHYYLDTPRGASKPVLVPAQEQPFSKLIYKQILDGEAILDNRTEPPKTFLPFGDKDRPSKSLLFAPIIFEETPVGFVTIQSYDAFAYSQEDLKNLTTIANQLGGVLKRTQDQAQLLVQQTLIEQSPAVIMVTDPDGTIEYVNPRFTKVTGYTAEEVIGANPRILKSGHHTERFYGNIWKALTAGQTWRGIICNKKKNGDLFWESASISPVKDDQNKTLHFVAVKEDITEQISLTENLRASERKFRALFEESQDAIYITDGNGKLLEFNPAFRELFGYMDDELKGINVAKLYLNRSDRRRFRDTIRKKGYIKNYPVNLKRKDGTIMSCLISSSVQSGPNASGKYQGIIRDISKIEKARKELETALAKAESAEKVKSLFLANMSHEIRTPLNSIIGFSRILEERFADEATEEDKKFFQIIDHSGDRLMRTIHEIMDISQIEAGTLELSPSSISLKSLIRIIATQLETEISDKGLDMIVHLDDALDDMVYADQYCVSQALTNLLDNAIKYTNEGKIEIRLTKEKGRILLIIQDTGIGMSDEYLERVFDTFSQESSGYTKEFQGVGLGMALTKRYLELNHIDLELSSEKGVGTTVRLLFPIQGKTDTQVLPVEDLTPSATPVTETERHYRILIVEDDINSQKLAEFILKPHKTFVRETVSDSWELLQKEEIDIVLLDLSLKGNEDGLALVRKIRTTENVEHLPVVALTAHAFTEDRERCFNAGCNDFLTKPIQREQLHATLNQLMDKNQ
ncbi:MAG: PAS domain S-box protein [Fidelibacterota bacterium]